MKSVVVLISVIACSSASAQVRNNSPSGIGNPINTVNPSVITNPTSNSNSNSQGGTAQGGTARGGTAGATANPASTASSGSSTVAIQTGNTTFPSGQSILSVPTVYVPSIATGNVCAIGASGGASWLGAGFAFGSTWESMQCERRQTAALLWNMNTPESRAAAKEVLCNSPEIREAYARSGVPCTVDLMRVTGPASSQQVPPQPATQVAAFDASQYTRASECLTAAQSQGVSLSVCAGKK